MKNDSPKTDSKPTDFMASGGHGMASGVDDGTNGHDGTYDNDGINGHDDTNGYDSASIHNAANGLENSNVTGSAQDGPTTTDTANGIDANDNNATNTSPHPAVPPCTPPSTAPSSANTPATTVSTPMTSLASPTHPPHTPAFNFTPLVPSWASPPVPSPSPSRTWPRDWYPPGALPWDTPGTPEADSTLDLATGTPLPQTPTPTQTHGGNHLPDLSFEDLSITNTPAQPSALRNASPAQTGATPDPASPPRRARATTISALTSTDNYTGATAANGASDAGAATPNQAFEEATHTPAEDLPIADENSRGRSTEITPRSFSNSDSSADSNAPAPAAPGQSNQAGAYPQRTPIRSADIGSSPSVYSQARTPPSSSSGSGPSWTQGDTPPFHLDTSPPATNTSPGSPTPASRDNASGTARPNAERDGTGAYAKDTAQAPGTGTADQLHAREGRVVHFATPAREPCLPSTSTFGVEAGATRRERERATEDTFFDTNPSNGLRAPNATSFIRRPLDSCDVDDEHPDPASPTPAPRHARANNETRSARDTDFQPDRFFSAFGIPPAPSHSPPSGPVSVSGNPISMRKRGDTYKSTAEAVYAAVARNAPLPHYGAVNSASYEEDTVEELQEPERPTTGQHRRQLATAIHPSPGMTSAAPENMASFRAARSTNDPVINRTHGPINDGTRNETGLADEAETQSSATHNQNDTEQ